MKLLLVSISFCGSLLAVRVDSVTLISLCYFCEKGEIEEVKNLIETIDDINDWRGDHSHRGPTPLHVATQYGHLPIVQLLVEHGANVDTFTLPLYIKDKNLYTPICDAIQYGHFQVFKYLLDKGANLNVYPKYPHKGTLVKLVIESMTSRNNYNNDLHKKMDANKEQEYLSIIKVLIGLDDTITPQTGQPMPKGYLEELIQLANDSNLTSVAQLLLHKKQTPCTHVSI